MRDGDLDAFGADQSFFHYSRAAKELWKFCNLGDLEITAAVIGEQGVVDWWGVAPFERDEVSPELQAGLSLSRIANWRLAKIRAAAKSRYPRHGRATVRQRQIHSYACLAFGSIAGRTPLPADVPVRPIDSVLLVPFNIEEGVERALGVAQGLALPHL